MSKATKRKHVTKEVLDEYVLPEGNRQIVRVVASRGNNLHEIESAGGERCLASMPTKFRKNVWIKRGDFVMVEPIDEGDKVKAEIVVILYKDQIKYIKSEKMWPKEFGNEEESSKDELIPSSMMPPSDSDDSDAENDGLFVNQNRAQVYYEESEEESEEEESEGELEQEEIRSETTNGHQL